MAKCKCKVEFGQFHWNPSGYKEVANSGAVQALVKEPAQRVYSKAQAASKGKYVMKQVQGRFAKGWIVGTDDEKSMYENECDNTLLKAFGSV